MRSSLIKIAFTAAITLTLFGCGGGGGGDDNYESVKIGSQTWMKENLNINVTGSMCYNNEPANCTIYGRLYTWEAAKSACPSGWRLPSNADWDELYHYVDGTSGTESPYRSSTAGKDLKAISGWSNDGNGNDTHGFTALPSGVCFGSTNCTGIGGDAQWWTSSEDGSSQAYLRRMYDFSNGGSVYSNGKTVFASVRCIKK